MAIIRKTLNLDNPEPLTAEEEARLERHRNIADDDIDTSDIPELTESFFKATDGWTAVDVASDRMVDRDLVEWFRARGPDYRERLNAVLRAHVEREDAA